MKEVFSNVRGGVRRHPPPMVLSFAKLTRPPMPQSSSVFTHKIDVAIHCLQLRLCIKSRRDLSQYAGMRQDIVRIQKTYDITSGPFPTLVHRVVDSIIWFRDEV